MKKNLLLKIAAAAALLMAPATFLTSCGDVIWTPGAPPSGWYDTFYDSAITGRWRLIMANGASVSGTAVNYMEFDGAGRGYYTYWDQGELYSERLGYYCEAPYGNYSDYQINIQYQYSSPVTMIYWMTGRNTLNMQWVTGNGRVITYVYARTYDIP